MKSATLPEKKPESSKVNERRKNTSENVARKALYGWAQESPVCFQQCKEMPGYGADQVKLGFFSRDFLFQFVSAGRLMLGKDVTVALAKKSDCWHAINHTREKDHRYSGMYRLAEDELEKGWQ